MWTILVMNVNYIGNECELCWLWMWTVVEMNVNYIGNECELVEMNVNIF